MGETLRLFLATSCLQGRPLQAACEELLTLPVDGLQLCAGNAPTPGFDSWRSACNQPIRTHHGFTPHALRAPVWSANHELTAIWDSVHPPRSADPEWLPESLPDGVSIEVMYGRYPLGTGRAVERAMAHGLFLAVDVSHVHIQLCQGTMQRATWSRLRDYDHIPEIHVSANDGRSDRHDPIDPDTFGLDWVRERASGRVPVVVESYWHRVESVHRRRQLEHLRS